MTEKEFLYQYALGLIPRKELLRVAKETESKKILAALSVDKDFYIRRWVANNSHTPLKIMRNLKKDSNSQVRRDAKEPFIPLCVKVLIGFGIAIVLGFVSLSVYVVVGGLLAI